MNAWLVLVLDVVFLVVCFGWRSWVHRRRTGSAGFRGAAGGVGSAGWWGGALFVVALACSGLAPALALLDVTPALLPLPAGPSLVAGLLLALSGFAVTTWAQGAMGASWRIGVDPAERTALVAQGPFL